MDSGGSSAGPWRAVIGWGAYLAASWTWCIGMFLPVLLVRDYGVWGFVVFAIPNCLGAAVSGMAMQGRDRARWFVRAHGDAARWFSYVTIAFQAFFAGWMLTVFPPAWGVGAALIWVVLAVAARRRRSNGLEIGLAAAALGVTLVAMVSGFVSNETSLPRHVLPFDRAVAALAPVCAFGFALCPYLDLTFWRARGEVRGGPGAAAFALGFLVLFPMCLLFSLSYAARLGDAEEFASLRSAGSVPTLLLAVHLCVQLAVTVHFHSAEAREASLTVGRGGDRLSKKLAGKLVVFVVPLLLGAAGSWAPPYGELAFNEVVYRVFMSAYGLVFPAYVWLCLIPAWRTRSRPSARSIAVWLASCLVAAPMFWAGFIEQREVWLLPGLGVVILARLLIPRAHAIAGPDSGEPPERSGAPVPVPSGPPSRGALAIPEREPPETPGPL